MDSPSSNKKIQIINLNVKKNGYANILREKTLKILKEI